MLDALGAAPGARLRATLGPELHDELRRELLEHALAWARTAGDDVAPRHLARVDELPAALAGHEGPVVIVAPDVPTLAAHHLTAIRDDLAAGVTVTTAATGDATPYLVGLASADPELLALVGAPFAQVVAAAVARGGELGVVRTERRLATLADARALLADPLAPPALRRLLAGLR